MTCKKSAVYRDCRKIGGRRLYLHRHVFSCVLTAVLGIPTAHADDAISIQPKDAAVQSIGRVGMCLGLSRNGETIAACSQEQLRIYKADNGELVSKGNSRIPAHIAQVWASTNRSTVSALTFRHDLFKCTSPEYQFNKRPRDSRVVGCSQDGTYYAKYVDGRLMIGAINDVLQRWEVAVAQHDVGMCCVCPERKTAFLLGKSSDLAALPMISEHIFGTATVRLLWKFSEPLADGDDFKYRPGVNGISSDTQGKVLVMFGVCDAFAAPTDAFVQRMQISPGEKAWIRKYSHVDVQAVSVSPCGEYLVINLSSTSPYKHITHEQSSIEVLDASNGATIGHCRGALGTVVGVALSEKAERLAVLTQQGQLYVWRNPIRN